MFLSLLFHYCYCNDGGRLQFNFGNYSFALHRLRLNSHVNVWCEILIESLSMSSRLKNILTDDDRGQSAIISSVKVHADNPTKLKY